MGLLDKVTGFLGSAGGGALAGLGVDLLGGAASAWQAEQSRDFQQRVLKNQVQWRVQDLKKAGINPILAAGMGLGAGSAPGSSVPSMPQGMGSSAYANFTNRKLAENTISKLDSEVALNRAIAAKELSQVDLNKVLEPYYRGLTLDEGVASSKAVAETERIKTDMKRIVQVIRDVNLSGSLKLSEIKLKEMSFQERKALLPFLIQLQRSEALRAELGLPLARNMAAAERTWWKREVAPFLSDATKVGGIAGGVVGAAGVAKAIKKLDTKKLPRRR